MYNIVAVLLRSRVQFSMLRFFYILYNNNNSDKLDPLYSEIPTGLLVLDSYWIPTGLLVLDSSIPIP